MSIDQFLLSADTTDLNYPEVRPTLDLNFARTKTLDPRIEFTRASGGSYVGADGLIKYAGVNEPRFDHDPVTGESLGLLVEEQRSNLLLRSEEFNSTSWSKDFSRIATNTTETTAPDGSNNAEKLIENTSNSQHIVYQSRTGSNETVVFSVFCKSAERTSVLLQLSNSVDSTVNVIFNLFLGTVTSISPSNADYTNNSASIIPYPNGWYRCIITTTKGSVNTTNIPTISTVAGGVGSYQGDGTSGIYIWGAQVEQGTFPTSYIPTQASIRTRAADNARITGSNFSSWYRQDEGTFFGHISQQPGQNIEGVSYRHLLMASPNASTNSSVGLFVSGFNRYSLQVRNNSANQAVIETGTHSFATGRFCGAYRANDFAISANGGAPAADTSGEAPTTDPPVQLSIGGIFNATALGKLNGTIRRLTYYPKRLPNSQLQALTK